MVDAVQHLPIGTDAVLIMKASQPPFADTTLTSQVPDGGATPLTDTAVAGLLPVFLEKDIVLAHLTATARHTA